MELEGKVWKSETGDSWVARIDSIGFRTQGPSKKAALSAVRYALEANVFIEGFCVLVTPGKADTFRVSAEPFGPWLGFILQSLRQQAGLTLEEVARGMGFTSKTAYVRYEKGEVMPSVEKLAHMLSVLSPKSRILLSETA